MALGITIVMVLLAGLGALGVERAAERSVTAGRAVPPEAGEPSDRSLLTVPNATPSARAETTSTTALDVTTTAPVPPTSTTATTAPTPTTAGASTAAAPPDGAWSLAPYRGLGAWVDVYDWTDEFTGDAPPRIGRPQVDDMAAAGVQTLFIQTSHHRSASDVIEPDRLALLVERAHAHGMYVVAWYLPTLEDLETDLRRLVAGASVGVDGLGVDIESRHVKNVDERNRRLVELGTRLRAAVGDRAISAITPSSVHLQVVNTGFWPAFPWSEVAGVYDVIQPMAYWSIRRGELRNGERYIGENIDRIRASTGNAEIPIHPIGGIADGASVADLEGMVRASQARGAIGGSLYDWATSNPAQWRALAPFRTG